MKPIDALNHTYQTEVGTFFAELQTTTAHYARCLVRKNGNSLDVWYIGHKRVKGHTVQALIYEDGIPASNVVLCRRYQDETIDAVAKELHAQQVCGAPRKRLAVQIQ